MVYGGKSTIRDRSSGTASSVAFTPLQVPALWRQEARGEPCSPSWASSLPVPVFGAAMGLGGGSKEAPEVVSGFPAHGEVRRDR